MRVKTQEALTVLASQEEGEGVAGTTVGEGRRDKDIVSESLTVLENVLASTEVGDGRGTVVAVAVGGGASLSQGR